MGRRQGLLFIAPAIVVLAVLIAYPIAYTVVLSVTNEAGEFVGVKNYDRMASARVTGTAVWNTAYYVGGSIVFQLLLGTAAGILLNQKFRGRAVVRSAMLIPVGHPGHRRGHRLGVDVP